MPSSGLDNNAAKAAAAQLTLLKQRRSAIDRLIDALTRYARAGAQVVTIDRRGVHISAA